MCLILNLTWTNSILTGKLQQKYHCTIHMNMPPSLTPHYNLRYHPSVPFILSGLLVSYRIRLAMKFSQNVLHYKWNTSRVCVIHIKSLSRYFLLTENWTDKAKWRSIEASNNVNKHTGHGLLAVELAPRIKFALVKFNSTDGSTWQFVHSAAVPWRCFKLDGYQ